MIVITVGIEITPTTEGDMKIVEIVIGIGIIVEIGMIVEVGPGKEIAQDVEGIKGQLRYHGDWSEFILRYIQVYMVC